MTQEAKGSTVLPDEALLRQRLEQLPALPEDFDQ